jgi:hypothetical protein
MSIEMDPLSYATDMLQNLSSKNTKPLILNHQFETRRNNVKINK